MIKKSILIIFVLFIYSKINAQNSFEGIINYTAKSSKGNSSNVKVFLKKNKLRVNIVSLEKPRDTLDIVYDFKLLFAYESVSGQPVLKYPLWSSFRDNIFPILKRDNYKKDKSLLKNSCFAYSIDSTILLNHGPNTLFVIRSAISWFTDSLPFYVPDLIKTDPQIGGIFNGKQISLSVHAQFETGEILNMNATSIIKKEMPDSIFTFPSNAKDLAAVPKTIKIDGAINVSYNDKFKQAISHDTSIPEKP